MNSVERFVADTLLADAVEIRSRIVNLNDLNLRIGGAKFLEDCADSCIAIRKMIECGEIKLGRTL